MYKDCIGLAPVDPHYWKSKCREERRKTFHTFEKGINWSFTFLASEIFAVTKAAKHHKVFGWPPKSVEVGIK